MKKLTFLFLLLSISFSSAAMDISAELYSTAKEAVVTSAEERTGEENYAQLVDTKLVNGSISEVIFTSSWSTSVTDYSFDEGEPIFHEVVYSCTDKYSYVVKTQEIKYLTGTCN